MKSSKEKFEICETIVRILDGVVTPEEFQLFEKRLAEDAEVRMMYMTVLEAYSYMQRPGQSFRVNAMVGDDDDYPYQELWESLAKSEKEAPAIEVSQASQEPELIQKVTYEKRNRPFKKSTLIPLITAIAAAVMVVVFVRFAPVRNSYYGQITETHQAVFQDSVSGLQKGGYLADEPIKLVKGLAQIQMEDGSMILLEAPAELRLEADDQVFLIEGKLTASVPKSGIGFTVRTPSASIVDYGTEFGVSIDQYAKTEAHVLKGNVEMRLGSHSRVFDKSLRLSANQAASVSGQSLNMIPAELEQFTYYIPSSFEDYAMSLNPILYFRLKKDDLHTLCEVTGRKEIQILPSPELSVVTGPSLKNGKNLSALEMTGPGGLRVQNVSPVFANQTGDYTAACWVRFNQQQAQVIWSNRAGDISQNTNNAYYRILQINSDGKLEHVAYYPQNTVDSRKVNSVVSRAPLEAGRWYFVAVTHAKGGFKKLYINGELAAQSNRFQDGMLEKYGDLTFGQAVEELAPALDGAVSEILFFSRDLTEDENKKLYESAIR